MRIAIADPASGIAGDMFLGALIDVGLDRAWLERLPAALGLNGVVVRIADVQRASVHCVKVDFDIPPQPHGRPVSEIHSIIDAAPLPPTVAAAAHATFDAIAGVESEIHGVSTEDLHLHEVGSVDAILDIVGSIWGLEMLGVEQLYNTRISLGDGTVRTAHGRLPVPAPATARLLEGFSVRHGPEGSGELATPTGAALLKVLSGGPAPLEYKPERSGYGAGTRDIDGHLNALRIIIGESAGASHAHHHEREQVHQHSHGDDSGHSHTHSHGDGHTHPHSHPQDGVQKRQQPHAEKLYLLSADIDDMSPEELAAGAEELRREGALDVVLIPATMKKGRLGTRLEVLVRPADFAAMQGRMFVHFTTIGVRRSDVVRTALARRSDVVKVGDRTIRVKIASLPDGTTRAKAEHDDLRDAARELGCPISEIREAAMKALDEATLPAGDSHAI